MKRLAALFAILSLVALSGALACDKDDAAKQAAATTGTAVRQVSLTGYLTDSHCGAAAVHAKGKSCHASCMKNGAKVQLYSSDKLYNLDKVEGAASLMGAEVKVTGLLDEATNTIKVESIENVAKS